MKIHLCHNYICRAEFSISDFKKMKVNEKLHKQLQKHVHNFAWFSLPVGLEAPRFEANEARGRTDGRQYLGQMAELKVRYNP